MTEKIRVGTRKSPLALAQTTQYVAALCQAHGWEPGRVEIIGLSTKGDEILDRSLTEIGGKGLFTYELEEGLLNGTLDFAVHSLKDLPTQMPDGLTLGCIAQREDPRDVLITVQPVGTPTAIGLDNLVADAVLGSASLRRIAQIKAVRPDIKPQPLRGNIATRITKIINHQPDNDAEKPQATLLAAAGLNRMRKMEPEFDDALKGAGNKVLHYELLPADVMLPAPGQGALGIQCRQRDEEMLCLLKALDCAQTRAAVTAERAYLAALEGSCRTPIAALAEIRDAQLHLRAKLLAPDGTDSHSYVGSASINEAEALGKKAAAMAKADKPHLLPKTPNS